MIEVKVLGERLREETLQPKNPFAHSRADFCSGLTGTWQSLCQGRARSRGQIMGGIGASDDEGVRHKTAV
jgi:hypothetical protein